MIPRSEYDHLRSETARMRLVMERIRDLQNLVVRIAFLFFLLDTAYPISNVDSLIACRPRWALAGMRRDRAGLLGFNFSGAQVFSLVFLSLLTVWNADLTDGQPFLWQGGLPGRAHVGFEAGFFAYFIRKTGFRLCVLSLSFLWPDLPDPVGLKPTACYSRLANSRLPGSTDLCNHAASKSDAVLSSSLTVPWVCHPLAYSHSKW